MVPSQSMSPKHTVPSVPSAAPAHPRDGLPMRANGLGDRLPKKGAVPPSAKTPGLVSLSAKPQLGRMTQSIRHLIPLIPMLTRRARRLARAPSDVDDIVQDTLLSLCQRLRDGKEIEDLPAYAMRTLSNRARRGWRPQMTEELEEDVALTEPVALVRLDCADTLAAIAALPDPQRTLMEHVARGETSPRALAQATGLPLGTVMSRLARARARLRLTLSEDGAPEDVS